MDSARAFPGSDFRDFAVRALRSPAFLPLCFLVFVLSRLILVLLVPVAPYSDASWYFDMARGLVQTGEFSEEGVPTAYWPVGYPALLAAIFSVFGASVTVAQMANLAMASASFVLLYFVAQAMFPGGMVGRLALLAFTLYPNNAAYVPLVLSETGYAFLLFLGSVLLFASTRHRTALVAAGLVFGLATLVKTQTLLLAPLLAIAATAGTWTLPGLARGVGRAAIVSAVALAVVAPWTWRNYQVFDAVVLVSTNGGTSLLAGNNPSLVNQWRRSFSEDDPLYKRANFSIRDQVAADRRARQLAWQWISENPGTFLGLLPQKFFQLWAIDGEAEWGYQEGSPLYKTHAAAFRAARYANQAYYVAVMVLSMVGIIMVVRSRAGPHVWYGVVVAGYFTVLCLVFSGQSRYHFPVMSFLLIYAAWAALQMLVPERPARG